MAEIVVTMSVQTVEPREGQSYPTKTTMLEFTVAADMSRAVSVYQEALRTLTQPSVMIVEND